jgi:hypothetical protein
MVPMLLGVLKPVAAQEQQTPKPSIEVTITAPAAEAKLGSPFQLKLQMMNISDHGITYAMSGPIDGPVYKKVLLRYMDIQVRDSGGNLVAETEYGKTIHGRSLGPPTPVVLDPNPPHAPLRN